MQNGSIIPAGTKGAVAAFLEPAQIMEKHGLSCKEFEAIKAELYALKLIDILWRFPDGPRYDILLCLVATSR
jgi:hypothetical protein